MPTIHVCMHTHTNNNKWRTIKTPDTSALYTRVYTHKHICLQHSTYTDTYAYKHTQSLMVEGCTELYHRFLVTLRVRICPFCIHAEVYRAVPLLPADSQKFLLWGCSSSQSPHLPVAPTNPSLTTLAPPRSPATLHLCPSHLPLWIGSCSSPIFPCHWVVAPFYLGLSLTHTLNVASRPS